MRKVARSAAPLLVALSLLGAGAAPARAARLAVAPLVGGLRIDQVMADYRWELGPVALVGVAATASAMRWTGGVRVWRAKTSQGTGIAGEDFAPSVALTSVEGTARFAVVRALGLDVGALASAGRLHVGFAPDRAIVGAAGGEGVEVRYEPIGSWIGGAGLELSRRIARKLEAGAAVERLAWRMDAAHRDGDGITEERIGTGAWALRVALSLGAGGR